MAVFRNRKEKKDVEKGLIKSGESVADAAEKRPLGTARNAYQAAKDFDKAFKASKMKQKRKRGKPPKK
ncbi:MAG: hypothetical protein M0T81_04180 [Thermoplasmatales archaeon]|jgi:hypothetical protein|nr:hypothetical protein [Candidatus Thermoplasmatota archaeon]MDA8143161.1 hypothetical protein [Thermoplasmatales archaeon]